MSLNGTGNGSHRAADLEQNIWLRLVARGSMILSAAVLPMALYIGYTTLQRIDKTAAETLAETREAANAAQVNRESIIQLNGRVDGVAEINREQDRRLNVVERRLDGARDGMNP